jgi:hypothetical protein
MHSAAMANQCYRCCAEGFTYGMGCHIGLRKIYIRAISKSLKSKMRIALANL